MPGELAGTIGARTREPGVVRIICPPYVCLAAVGAALATPDVAASDGSGVAVGAQNVHHEAAGAYTGEISAAMLAGLATWVIVGHSERRRDAHETDALIGLKLARRRGRRPAHDPLRRRAARRAGGGASRSASSTPRSEAVSTAPTSPASARRATCRG